MTFPAQSPDLRRFPLVAGASRSVVRSPRSAAPRIRFLFVDSRVRFTLRSAYASRRTPCASLRSLRPGSGRTFTSKSSPMPGPPPFYGAGGQDAPSPRAVGSFFDRRRPHGLDCPVDDSGWGGVRSQGPHRSPEDVHSRRVLRSGAGTILLSGTLWPIASFGSPGVHSL